MAFFCFSSYKHQKAVLNITTSPTSLPMTTINLSTSKTRRQGKSVAKMFTDSLRGYGTTCQQNDKTEYGLPVY